MNSIKIRLFCLWVLAFFICSFPLGAKAWPPTDTSSTATAEREKEKELDSFFQRMGFKDITGSIHARLARDDAKNLTPLQETNLKMSAKRYSINSDARALAARLLVPLYENMNDTAKINLTIELTATLMALKPMFPPQDLPAGIKNMPATTDTEKSAKAKSIINYFTRVTSEQITSHTEKVTSEIVGTAYGVSVIEDLEQKEITKTLSPDETNKLNQIKSDSKEIELHVHNLLTHMYLDAEMGATNPFAWCMALGLTKFEIDRNRTLNTKSDEITQKLKKAALEHGQHLQNFVGDTLYFQDRSGSDREVVMKTGLVILERSGIYPTESAAIAAGARPAWQNTLRTMSRGLWGYLLAAAIPLNEDKMGDGFTFTDSLRYSLSQWKVFNKGVSHAGTVLVNEDPETGIKNVMAVDIYPGLEHGGIRMTSIPNNFALPGPVMRFATVEYDPFKVLDWFRIQVKQGYNPVAWEGTEEEFDENGNTIIPKNPKVKNWPTLISEADFYKQLPPAGSSKEVIAAWYNGMLNKVVNHIIDTGLITDGYAFAEHFSSAYGRVYCSKLFALPFKQLFGLDIERYPDRWNLAVTTINKLKIADLSDIAQDINQRMVTPSGLAAQPTVKQVELIDLRAFPGGLKQRIAENYAPYFIEAHRKLTSILKDWNIFPKTSRIEKTYTDGDSDNSVITYQDDRYVNIMTHFDRAVKKEDKKKNNLEKLMRAGAQHVDSHVTQCLQMVRRAVGN